MPENVVIYMQIKNNVSNKYVNSCIKIKCCLRIIIVIE